MKIFGREPAFWVALVEAFLALLLSFDLFKLTPERTSLIVAVVMAAFGFYTAYVTKDTMLGVGVGLAKALLALGVGFGLNLTTNQTGVILAFITVALGGYQRSQTMPLAVPTMREQGGFLHHQETRRVTAV